MGPMGLAALQSDTRYAATFCHGLDPMLSFCLPPCCCSDLARRPHGRPTPLGIQAKRRRSEAAVPGAAACEDVAETDSETEGLGDMASFYSGTDTDVWEELQVSADTLTDLQRALYERRTPPALVALVTFGLRTTPLQQPRSLLNAVRDKLNSHAELWKDLHTI